MADPLHGSQACASPKACRTVRAGAGQMIARGLQSILGNAQVNALVRVDTENGK